MKRITKQDSQKDDNKQSPSVEKEIDASSESGKDKTPATKPAKGEVESSSTTPTKVVSATQNVAKPTSASSETTKGVVQTSAGSSEAKDNAPLQKQTLKTQMMDILKAKTIKIHKKIKLNHYHKLVKNRIKI